MNKFASLLKKEIRELLTLQLILPLLIGILAFVFIGNIVGNEGKKASSSQKIAVLDLDATATSNSIVDMLEKSNFKVELYKGQTIESVIESAKSDNLPVVLSIPKGFEEGIQQYKPQQIENYSIVKNFSIFGSIGARTVEGVLRAMNEYVSNMLITEKAPSVNPQDLKNPVVSKDFMIVGDKTANVNPGQVMGAISSQTMFIPIIMFIIIIMASQMIAVTIASEKENKTLETLLSTPISRISLVSAKMIAAGIVSLVMAVAYMFGMSFYLNGLTGNAFGAAAGPQISEAMSQLGLSLDTSAYILIGISLFLSILIALAISLILGAFAEDVKKAQGLIAPIIFLIMIPYILSMFVDLNSASPVLKYFVYAIPFSHSFLAATNVYLNQYSAVVYGAFYQALVFIVLVIIAAKIFTTDRILTMKLNFKSRSLFNRNR